MNDFTAQNYIIEDLISPISLMTAISIAGILGNACIVLVTFKNKSIQGVCNILIAIEAAFAVLTEFCTPSYLYFILSENHYVTVRTCWYIQIIPFFCANMSFAMTLIIGIDRLLSIIAPIFVRKISRTKYLWVALCFPLISSATLTELSYEPMLVDAENYVFCTTTEFKRGFLRYAHYYYNLCISGILVLLYAYIWISVKTKKVVSGASRKILKSLTVITIVIVGAWPVSQLGLLLTRILFLPNPQSVNTIVMYFGVLVQVGFAMNFYVYFCFSQEYRIAFQKLFSCLPCCKKNSMKNANTHVVTVVPLREKYQNTSL